jgi:predicted nucleic acid-binding Zn ribbon protein
MAFCTNCGTQFNEKQEFCTNCGALLKPEHSSMSIGTKIIILLILLIGIVLSIVTIKNSTKNTSLHNKSETDKTIKMPDGNQKNVHNQEQDEETTGESAPMTELRQEAENWIKKSCSFEEKQGEYFSFRCGAVNPCTDCGSGENKWTATSEVEIGDCPAGNVWVMVRWANEEGEGGNNKVPPECKSITPKVIINFNFSKDYN